MFVFNSHIGPSQGGSRFARVLSGFTISIKGVNASHYLSHVDIMIWDMEKYLWLHCVCHINRYIE